MSEKGEEIPIGNIYPNRLNPNEMEPVDIKQLKNDVLMDDYDPITVSPLGVFYTAKARKDSRVTAIIPHDADPEKTYIICDGYHRHKAASQIGITHIRAVIKHQTEADAMPHFYRRHRLRGKLEPLKEAELFRHELDERNISRAELVKLYNLSGVSYLKTRLALLNITTEVVDLYYESPPDLPGRLTISHLRSLSFIPKNLQFAVAMMSLERNWTILELRAEVRRIKEGKGTAQSEIAAPDAPPGSHPTLIQRHLHQNVTRFLKPSEEKTVRYIKKKGESTVKEIGKEIGITHGTLSFILRDLCKLEILEFREERRSKTGRASRIYRLYEPLKSEYARDTPLTDEELLKQYPEVFKKTITDDTTTVKEKLKKRVPSERFKEGDASVDRVEPEAPDAWRERVSDQFTPREQLHPRDPLPVREPPLVLDQARIEDFAEAIYKMAIVEGFNIKGKKPIDGQDPGKWLEKEIEFDLKEWAALRAEGKRDFRVLVAIGLRACQLFHRHREM